MAFFSDIFPPDIRELYVSGFFHSVDATANANTKTFDTEAELGAGVGVMIDYMYISYTTTTAIGTRQFEIDVLDADGNTVTTWNLDDQSNTAASSTIKILLSAGDSLAKISQNGGAVRDFLPLNFVLQPGFQLKFLDLQGVDPNDDFEWHIHGRTFRTRDRA